MKNLFLFICLGMMMQCLTAQINELNMDKTIRPQDDIFQYVNGSWMKKTEIPSDRTRWGSFDELRENTDINSLKLLNGLLKNEYKRGTDEQKMKDFYNSIINMDARNKKGMSPLEPYFAKLDQIQNFQELEEYMYSVAKEGNNPIFSIYVGAHMKKSDYNTVYLTPIELGLGRDYYQKNDDKSAKALANYTEYIQKLIDIIHPNLDNKNLASEYVQFEKDMAQSLLTVENLRNSELQYNPVTTRDLKNMVKTFNLQQYLFNLNAIADTIIINEINYFKSFDDNLKKQNIAFVKEYFKIHLLNKSMTLLTTQFDEMRFDFYGKKLTGQKVQRSMDKRALEVVNSTLGEILGKAYVAKMFPPEAKAQAVELVKYLNESFKQHIKNLTWMSEATKLKALEKLSKITVKIGYPDKWKDYSNVRITSIKEGGSYFGNIRQYAVWHFEDNIAKLGKPVDKTEWGMNPQTVNAYYNESYNEIVFPAAILQPPFYNYKANPAVNFGGVGAVIGHEISHGFDDGGSQYDGDGNLNNWWTEEDKKKFEKATQALADQYSTYEPLPGVFLNGKFTLGENIADLGGVSVAFDAMQSYMRDYKEIKLNKSSYCPEKEFFMSWATIWRTKMRDAELINRVKTDPHSPGYYRALGPLSNVNAFYTTFDVKPTDKMFKAEEKRIVIW